MERITYGNRSMYFLIIKSFLKKNYKWDGFAVYMDTINKFLKIMLILVNHFCFISSSITLHACNLLH